MAMGRLSPKYVGRLAASQPTRSLFRLATQGQHRHSFTSVFAGRHCPLTDKPMVRAHGTHHGHDHEHADLATLLHSSSKRGMRITWIGLGVNLVLTTSKGAAGWLMNSASLLADAAHSLSDLLSDFTTLYTFKMSRKPPDSVYPYGYGKYETLGSVAVSTVLLAGSAAIGIHSFEVLVDVLQGTSAVASQAQEAAATAASVTQAVHSHHHTGPLDPNAAWFALVSVIVKEWLYRATVKVGKSERSDVLIANAWHHRSDAYSSLVALVAILGSYAGAPVLDPIGGLLVSAMIIKQGKDIMASSFAELMDKGISESQLKDITNAIYSIQQKHSHLTGFHSIRGKKQGPFEHIDLVLEVNPTLSMHEVHHLEHVVRAAIQKQFPQIQEVLISLDTERQHAEGQPHAPTTPPTSDSHHCHHHDH